MFTHVTLRVADRAAAEVFYRRTLAGLDVVCETSLRWEDLRLAQADAEHPATTGVHLGLVSPSSAPADALWAVGRAIGAPDDGAPGPRPVYGSKYYGSFLRDPDGSSVAAPVLDPDGHTVEVADHRR